MSQHAISKVLPSSIQPRLHCSDAHAELHRDSLQITSFEIAKLERYSQATRQTRELESQYNSELPLRKNVFWIVMTFFRGPEAFAAPWHMVVGNKPLAMRRS
jgi:hypothetical protein